LPEWREEHYRLDPKFPVMRRKEFWPGVERPAYHPWSDKSPVRPEFLRQGSTLSEATRAGALYRTHFNANDPLTTYQFTNAMTSTQNKRPVTSVYGPMLREPVYGLRASTNRHGFMPAHDFY